MATRFDGLRIWEGYTFAYAPKLINGGVGDNPGSNDRSTPLKFRMLTGIKMGGAFGLCCDVRKWSQADLDLAKTMIEYYKNIRRDSPRAGDLYRLASLREGNLPQQSMWRLMESKPCCSPFCTPNSSSNKRRPSTCAGSTQRALYRLTPIDDKLAEKQRVLSGSYLTNHGLDFNLVGDFDSTSVLLERVE
jgi:alpha-galactosidase